MIVSLYLITYTTGQKSLDMEKNKAHAEHDMFHMYLI